MAVRNARLPPLSKAETLEALGSLARKLGRPPQSRDVSAMQLERGVNVHFGSLARARDATGLGQPPTRRKWTEERVIADLRALAKRRVHLSRTALAAMGRHDLLNAIADLGGIKLMRQRAGVPEPKPPKVKRTRWDDDRVIAEILERDERGESLAYTKTPAALTYQGWKRFGSWREAVTTAGLDYDRVTLAKRWTDAEILRALRALRRERPMMSRHDLMQHALGQAAFHHFGDLDAALARARLRGWPVWHRHSVPSRRAVLAGLRARHADGLPMLGTVVSEEDPALSRAARHYFASFAEAVAAARLPDANGRRRWSTGEVLEGLARRAARGLPMNSLAVEKADHRLFKAAKRRFGNWGAVLAALRRRT